MRYIITFSADNKPGVLYKVTGLCMQKRANIEKLNAREVDPITHLSKVRLEVTATKDGAARIAEHIAHIVEVHEVRCRVIAETR
jgi:acetolactate synthase small subunit